VEELCKDFGIFDRRRRQGQPGGEREDERRERRAVLE